MKQVSQKEFFNALAIANKEGLDPMPQRNSNDWKCSKTYRIFGRSIHIGSPNKYDYYLTSALYKDA